MPVVVDPSITALQNDIYEAIKEAWRIGGMAPTQSEIARAMPCSVGAVQVALKALRKGGHITTGYYKERSAKPVDMERTIVRKPPDPWDDLAPKPRRTYFTVAEP